MRFGAGAFALILMAATNRPVPASDGSGSLDALLARIRAASGTPYAAHIVSEAHEIQDGRSYTVRVETEGDRSVVRRCRDGICGGEYFDGTRFFAVNLNDTALPGSLRRDDDERVVRAIESSAFATPEFRASGGSVSELPPIARNGKTYRRLVVRSGDVAFVVLVDPSTAVPVEARTPDGRVAFGFGDFRKVDGVTLPFETTRGNVILERYDSRRVSHDPFAAPSGLAPTFGANPQPLRMIPVPRQPGNEPVVPCSIGGVTVNCLIDTGNSSLGISLELAERLGLEATGEYEVSGLGRYLTGIVTAGPLVVGGTTFPSARYVVLHDLHGYGYDIVLGADVLAHTRVTIDYPQQTVKFESPERETAIASIPLLFRGFIPVVGTQLGALDVPLALDTGDEATVNVSYNYYSDHPGLFQPRAQREVAGIGGSADQIVGEIASIRLATFDVTHQAIAATRASEPSAGGHLGSGFLMHFTVTLDYTRARLGLVPRPNDAAVHATL
jgi:hypothetical protein